MDKAEKRKFFINGTALVLLIIFAFIIRFSGAETSWQQSGVFNFSFAFLLLAAYLSAISMKQFRLPMLSGYILAGVIAGPYVSGFLTKDMVSRFQFLDELALNFIAFSAGGALKMASLASRKKEIISSIVLQSVIIFLFGLLFILLSGSWFSYTKNMSFSSLAAFGILVGVISIARSPSSAMAIISETRSEGPFTDTVLGVTVAIDVLVIVFFTIALAAVKLIMSSSGTVELQIFAVLSAEITASIITGIIIGKCIAWYIEHVGHDLPLFLLFTAFAIAKAAIALSYYMNIHFHIHLALEPLLICMSAGFTIQNFSQAGKRFESTLENISLPIYILFFSIAGAALDIDALKVCWPIAVFIVFVRLASIFFATWLSAIINKTPPIYKKITWMAYVTQAGVAIGLAQIARLHYPEIGRLLITVVLAVITINQIVGPITLKLALELAGETEDKKNNADKGNDRKQ